MTRTRYLVLSTFLCLLGCDSPDAIPAANDSEASFAGQIAAVGAGKSDRIQVESAPLADADLAELANLPSLRELLVDHADSRMTNTGMKHLAKLPNLEHLRLRGPGIDDEALAEIAKIKSLQILNVPRGDFTDAGLERLKELPNLVQLRFGSPDVTDAGMKTLGEFPALKRLHLIGVAIKDSGLAELAKIERLESLYIDDASISDAGWEELFQKRPKLHVHINQEHHDRDPHKHPH